MYDGSTGDDAAARGRVTLVAEWKHRAVRATHGHYNSARRFETYARRFSVASLSFSLGAAVLTAVVLSSEAPDRPIRLAAVIVASIASLLALAGSQWNLGVRATSHRQSGAGYSEVRRLLEVFEQHDVHDLDSSEFRAIAQAWASISQAAPTIPKREWLRLIAADPVQATGEDPAASARRSPNAPV